MRRHKRHPALTKDQQKLVEEHKWIASRLAHSAKCLTGGVTGCLTREDLESIAMFALCVAASRYELSRGVKYSTYAWSKARGYIQHALRDQSRMVRTPRWVSSHKPSVNELLKDGKSYEEVAQELELPLEKVVLCDMSTYNYHISYDNQPEDWSTKEFVFHVDEKVHVLSPELRTALEELSDAEIAMIVRYTEGESSSEEEREWASEKFWELQSAAYGPD